MIDVILLSLLLYFVHLLLPTLLLSTKHLPYLLSSREKPLDESALVGRAKRSFSNLSETYPVFLTLSVLAVSLEINMVVAANTWLICRAMYLVVYLLGISYVRTLVWFGSVVSLVFMALALT